MPDDRIKQQIVHALQGNPHEDSNFFQRWFIDGGKAYYFLFKKNLKVTNIQFAELLSLIVKYQISPHSSPTRLQFLTVQDFNATIARAVEAFFPDGLPQDVSAATPTFARIAELYADLLAQIVVVDCFFGSCAVFLPPDLDLRLDAICGASGYIHACGPRVYIRNVRKARKDRFFDAIDRYLSRRPTLPADMPKKAVFFAVYSHEDFGHSTHYSASDLRHGLDDVKIHVEKFYMGSDRLVRVLRDMREQFTDRLTIPQPGDHEVTHKEARKQHLVDTERTLWLLVESSLHQTATGTPISKYYVCYEQQYVNRSPFHIFDENKPAWAAHTTLPHTLAGAMINVALSYRPERQKIVIVDPFAGSGTTWLEAIKYDDAIALCGDKDDIYSLISR